MGFQGDSKKLNDDYWKTMAKRLQQRPCDVLITHGPPRFESQESFFLDRVFFGSHVGCPALSESIVKLWQVGKAPKFHVFVRVNPKEIV